MTQISNDPFAGFEDDLGEVYASAPAAAPVAPAARTVHELKQKAGETFTEPCKKCGGRGTYTFGYAYVRSGPCFECKGKGFKEFRSSPEARAKARGRVEAKKESARQDLAAQVAAWRAENAAEAAWIDNAAATGFEFAISLQTSLGKWGSLTDGQLTAVRKCVVKAAERQQQRAAEQEQRSAVIDTSAMEAAFARADEKGAKKAILRFAGFAVKRAPATGRNPGALYVTTSGEYIGKVQAGKFSPVRGVSQEVVDEVVAASADPKAAAIAYGRRTGCCSVCGRTLTDPASVDAGIGPICAEKFGW